MPRPTNHGQRMAGKTAIVTGAGLAGDAGIGSAIALVLAAEGAQVACVDRDGALAQACARQITDEGGKAIAITGDVSLSEVCQAIVQETVSAFGRLDVLVNNVGIATPLALTTADEAVWQRVFDVNLTSAMLMAKFSVPAMISGGGGSIVNISSLAGTVAHGALAYGPSKAAMTALAREIAVMHGRDGIRANSIAPGHIASPFVLGPMPPEARERRRKVGPLGIEGDVWDVALAALYLASDEARFLTGVLLPVDGGVSEVGALVAFALIND